MMHDLLSLFDITPKGEITGCVLCGRAEFNTLSEFVGLCHSQLVTLDADSKHNDKIKSCVMSFEISVSSHTRSFQGDFQN